MIPPPGRRNYGYREFKAILSYIHNWVWEQSGIWETLFQQPETKQLRNKHRRRYVIPLNKGNANSNHNMLSPTSCTFTSMFWIWKGTGRKQCIDKEVEKLSFFRVASENAQWYTEVSFDADFLLLNINPKELKVQTHAGHINVHGHLNSQ